MLERLTLLPSSARALLSAAAVAGRTFDLGLLARVTGLDEAASLDGLRALDLAAALDRTGTPVSSSPAIYKALLARGHALIHGDGSDGADAVGAAEGSGTARVDAGVRDFHQALELGLRHALPEVAQLAYNFLPRALLDLGRDADAARLLDQSDAYARRSGVAAIADTRGYALLHAGRWDEGITVLRAASAESRAVGALAKGAMELAALGHLLVARGDGQAAIDTLEEALAILDPSEQFVGVMPCLRGLACAHALLGDHEGATALFARAHTLWRATQDRVAVVPLLLEGCLFHAGRGDARRATEWADDLERVAGQPPITPVAAAAASHARGVARAAMGDHTGARQCLSAAAERWEGLGRPYDVARAAQGAAMLAGSHGDVARRAAADTLLVAAAAGFARLGATHAVAGVEDTRRRGGLLAQARRRQSLAADRAPYGDLTPREREVLALLAEGRTNRGIAQALFIVEGTAEMHVSRILGKLGCATRAQAAAYAVVNHLLNHA